MTMQTVAETKSYHDEAERLGLTGQECSDIVDTVAEDPEAGDLMQGTGGCRKLRVAGRGKGKSGGYRAITFFTGKNLPVFLIAIFGKGERANLNKAERNALEKMTKIIVDEYRVRIVKIGRNT